MSGDLVALDPPVEAPLTRRACLLHRLVIENTEPQQPRVRVDEVRGVGFGVRGRTECSLALAAYT